MQNKIHHIVDHSVDHPAHDVAHSTRIGLAVNTVIDSTPVVIDDIESLLTDKTEFEITNIMGLLPITLHVRTDHQIAILLVHDSEKDTVQCYPFSGNNPEGKWFLYDVAFDLVGADRVEIRPVHPWVMHADEPTQELIDHLEALAAIVTSFLVKLSDGSYLKQEEESLDKLNKKRVASDKHPVQADWKLINT